MAKNLLLATVGIALAAVVHFFFDGNFVLAAVILISTVWLVSSVWSRHSPDIANPILDPMERLMTPFQYLATLDTGDVESVGTCIYEKLDLDARSELSEHVVSALVESKRLQRDLATQIRVFRANVISKIDERVAVERLGDDPEWRVLLDESKVIHKKLLIMAG